MIICVKESSIEKIQWLIDLVKQPFENLFGGAASVFNKLRGLGGGGGDSEGGSVVSPTDRLLRVIEESRQTSTAEVTIKDETGRAELEPGKSIPGLGVTLLESGSF